MKTTETLFLAPARLFCHNPDSALYSEAPDCIERRSLLLIVNCWCRVIQFSCRGKVAILLQCEPVTMTIVVTRCMIWAKLALRKGKPQKLREDTVNEARDRLSRENWGCWVRNWVVVGRRRRFSEWQRTGQGWRAEKPLTPGPGTQTTVCLFRSPHSCCLSSPYVIWVVVIVKL